jgi:DNA modification methylase
MTSKKKQAPGGFKNAGSPHSYMLVDISDINPYANNPKQHPVWHVNQLTASIKQFGFITPIIINDKHEIIAGHGRYEAAKKLGLKQAPVILVSNLSDAQVKAYRIADNQLNLNTGHDEDLLRVELQELDKLDLDFDLEILGFGTGELDIIIGGEAPADNDEADLIPETKEQFITKLADIWILDNHRLLCGNSLEPANYKALMNGDTAHAVFSDPPYNVPVSGHICGNGKIQHDEFAMASGEMSSEEFVAFLATFIALVIEHSKDGSLHYLCIDWRGIHQLISAGHGQYSELKNICIWNKSNGGMGSLYRSKHEFVPVFKNGTAPHTNNVLLGASGRYRTNVWDYPGVNTFGGTDDLKLHPTVKPVAMVADAILDSTKRGEIVLDPFAGSGSTLIACEQVGRSAHCIELEPKYCDVIVRRWQEFTGQAAVHAETGQTFNDTQIQGDTGHE